MAQRPVNLFRTLRMVWFVLLVSLGIYGAMPWLLPPQAPAEVLPGFVAALTVVGLATAVATVILRRVALLAPVARGELDVYTQAGGAKLFTISILIWVFSESIGIYGLVLFFLYREAALLFAFLLPAVALLVYHAPREGAFRRVASSSELARPDVKLG